MINHFIRLSQAQLNLLETCPPQFQRIYLEQLGTPIDPQQQEKIAWGSQFHRLMQQKELKLPLSSLLAEDERLQHSIVALTELAPEIWRCDRDTWREAEHCRTIAFQGYLLTVIYDLIVADRASVKIYDWKTYSRPESPVKLAKNWQTRLYFFLMAETSDYLPEEISMTYWFVKPAAQPQCLTFTYDRDRHEQTRQDLTRLSRQLDAWLENYFKNQIPLPHLSNCQENCPHLQSLLMFESGFKTKSEVDKKDWQMLVKEIEEVAI